MSTFEILMNALAGLGLLFVGIKTVTRSLGALVGDQLRRWINWASKRPGVAVLFGVTAGFVAQSGRTTSFIMASFVHARLIEVRQAMPVVLWANLGCTFVIFASIFPLHLFALFLIAAAGICIAFERPKSFLNAASAVFGLALMLFGLKMTSSSATLLTDIDGVSQILATIGQSLPLAFLTGLVLTILAQSHMSIMLIVVAMAERGIFGFDQTLVLICGCHAGSALITYLTGVHFRGVPRQLVLAQILYNFVGIVLFLLFLAVYKPLAGVFDFALWAPDIVNASPGNQAAVAAVAFNFVTPLLLTLGLSAYVRLIARLSPPQEDDDLARPLFIRDEVSESVVATLMLIEQEQLRLLRRLPGYCEWLRGDGHGTDPATALRVHDAFKQVSAAIEKALGRLMVLSMTSDDTEWLLNQQKRQELLLALDAACHELFLAARNLGEPIEPLRVTVVEALDTILLTAIEAVANSDPQELDLIDAMTRNQGATMERVRKKYLAIFDGISIDDRGRILEVTSIFERAAWAAGNYAGQLRKSPTMT